MIFIAVMSFFCASAVEANSEIADAINPYAVAFDDFIE